MSNALAVEDIAKAVPGLIRSEKELDAHCKDSTQSNENCSPGVYGKLSGSFPGYAECYYHCCGSGLVHKTLYFNDFNAFLGSLSN